MHVLFILSHYLPSLLAFGPRHNFPKMSIVIITISRCKVTAGGRNQCCFPNAVGKRRGKGERQQRTALEEIRKGQVTRAAVFFVIRVTSSNVKIDLFRDGGLRRKCRDNIIIVQVYMDLMAWGWSSKRGNKLIFYIYGPVC